jgi:hypothetical protein
MEGFSEALSSNSSVKLRVAKPVAVPSADAPAIESIRFPKTGYKA